MAKNLSGTEVIKGVSKGWIGTQQHADSEG